MTVHNTRGHLREHSNIEMPITTSTDGESLSVMVGKVINQISLGSKIVGIPSYCRTNLARCKAILEINF